MQQCLSIVSDKSIVGGAVNRAKEMLEKAGERGRELRILHKKEGAIKQGGLQRLKRRSLEQMKVNQLEMEQSKRKNSALRKVGKMLERKKPLL